MREVFGVNDFIQKVHRGIVRKVALLNLYWREVEASYRDLGESFTAEYHRHGGRLSWQKIAT